MLIHFQEYSVSIMERVNSDYQAQDFDKCIECWLALMYEHDAAKVEVQHDDAGHIGHTSHPGFA